MIKLNDSVWIDPKEVTAVQDEVVRRWDNGGSPSDSSILVETFNGSIVVLKCGRKIAVNGLKPNQIMAMIQESR